LKIAVTPNLETLQIANKQKAPIWKAMALFYQTLA
jgi:hypothetical protein